MAFITATKLNLGHKIKPNMLKIESDSYRECHIAGPRCKNMRSTHVQLQSIQVC
jgi:hypothetical protein